MYGEAVALALLHRLQTLQNRAVRVITNTSYENADHELLLKRLNLLSFEQIIQFDNLCVIYKMVNGLAATNSMDLFQPAEKAHRYETRSNIDGKFKITTTRTKKKLHFQTLVPKYGMRFLQS